MFLQDAGGWGERARTAMAFLLVVGPGQAEAWGPGRPGVSWGVQAGRALDIPGQRLSTGWGSAALREASCGFRGGTLCSRLPEPAVSTAALLLAALHIELS